MKYIFVPPKGNVQFGIINNIFSVSLEYASRRGYNRTAG